MIGRIVSAVAVVVALAAPPTLAQDMVSPSAVLAGKSPRTFKDRTARIASIMGSEAGTAVPLKVPTKPAWRSSIRRDADAAAALR